MKITPSSKGTSSSHEETRALAYELWEQANRPDGRALEFWLEAEEKLIGKSRPQQPRVSRTPGSTKSNGARTNPKTAKRPAKTTATAQ